MQIFTRKLLYAENLHFVRPVRPELINNSLERSTYHVKSDGCYLWFSFGMCLLEDWITSLVIRRTVVIG